jgi:septum formation protein
MRDEGRRRPGRREVSTEQSDTPAPMPQSLAHLPSSSLPLSVPPSLILASGSPRRRELLAALGAPFEVRVADVPEPLLNGVPAAVQAETLAQTKVCAVAADAPSAAVLGADTIVVLDGVPLGKPGDPDEARRMLIALRGRAHEVVTGVALTASGDGSLATAHVETRVFMRAYTDAEIEDYIATGDPFDKAGAYAIQHDGFRPVERIAGCYCNVMGLPLWTVRRLLAEAAAGLHTTPPNERLERCAGCPESPHPPTLSPAAAGEGESDTE